MNSTLHPPSYDEDTIVDLVTEIYHILLRLACVSADQIIFPPLEGHEIDLSLLPAASLIDTRVLSLLKRLPYPDWMRGDVAIAPAMKPVCYLSADELLVSRDIDKKDYWSTPDGIPDVQNALPTSLLLFDSLYRDGSQLILDVQENSIRTKNLMTGPDEYLACQPETAPVVLQRMIDNYYRSKWLPNYLGDVEVDNQDPTPEFLELRRVLVEEYGWPQNFREQEWAANGGADWYEKLLNARDAAYRQGKVSTDLSFWETASSGIMSKGKTPQQ